MKKWRNLIELCGECGVSKPWRILHGQNLGTGYGHHILVRKFRRSDPLVKEVTEIELHPKNMNLTRQVLFMHFMIASVAFPEANETGVLQRWDNHPPEVTLPFLFLHK
jgi:hypothetical protein